MIESLPILIHTIQLLHVLSSISAGLNVAFLYYLVPDIDKNIHLIVVKRGKLLKLFLATIKVNNRNCQTRKLLNIYLN
jgi:hypothetical protein